MNRAISMTRDTDGGDAWQMVLAGGILLHQAPERARQWVGEGGILLVELPHSSTRSPMRSLARAGLSRGRAREDAAAQRRGRASSSRTTAVPTRVSTWMRAGSGGSPSATRRKNT